MADLAEIKTRWLVDGMTHEGCRKRPDNGCDLLDLIAEVEALREDRDWWKRQAYIRADLVEKLK